jgi:hypothetical protein
MIRVDLSKLDAFTRQAVLQELAGKSFKVGAPGDGDADPECPLPESMRASIAASLGASAGTFIVPTMAEFEAEVIAAAEARFKVDADNPWLPGRGWNLTRQIEIKRDDPAMAQRMKLAAGVR